MDHATTSSPVLTLGKGTRINCKSQRMAQKLTASLTDIGVPVEDVKVGPGEPPAVRVLAAVEVHFERALEIAFS